MRLFVCTWLGADNQRFYADLVADLIASSGGLLHAIPQASAHITYAFLARVDDRELGAIADAVRGVASRHGPIAIQLGPPSILYARAEARLVYTPITHGAETIAQLGHDIVKELDRRLTDVEPSGSRAPHVTLARFRKHTRRGTARVASVALERSGWGSEARADQIAEIQIVSSELTAAAPRYVTLFRATMTDGG